MSNVALQQILQQCFVEGLQNGMDANKSKQCVQAKMLESTLDATTFFNEMVKASEQAFERRTFTTAFHNGGQTVLHAITHSYVLDSAQIANAAEVRNKKMETELENVKNELQSCKELYEARYTNG